MHEGSAHRRRHARAIAISETVEAHRKAVTARIVLVLASATLALEAILVAHRYLAASHS